MNKLKQKIIAFSPDLWSVIVPVFWLLVIVFGIELLFEGFKGMIQMYF